MGKICDGIIFSGKIEEDDVEGKERENGSCKRLVKEPKPALGVHVVVVVVVRT